MQLRLAALAGLLALAPGLRGGELAGHQLLVTSTRTGDTEIFLIDPDTGDARNLTRSPKSEERYPCWSPDGKQVVYSGSVGDALELFVVHADGTGNRRLTRLNKVCTPAAWSPDGKWISFRHTDERYWSDPARMKKVYAEKPADKRPVWVIRPDGRDAHVIECLRYQCAMDGSRAAWRPR